MALATCFATAFEKRRLWERLNISVFLLWIAVLATALLRTPNVGAETRQGQDHD